MAWTAYRRVTVGQSCTFCLMLATRGAVYSSAAAASPAIYRYHDHCDCTMELESDFDRRFDVKIDPAELKREIAFRNNNRTYRYDLTRNRFQPPPATKVIDDVLPTGMTPDEALSGANPLNGKHNCVNSSAAYELRRRGLVVTAKRSRGKVSDRMIADLFDLPADQRDFFSSYGRIVWNKAPTLTPDVRKATGWRTSFDPIGVGDPDGARYLVQWEWHGGKTGHIIAAERRNGVTVFIDAQTGQEFTGMPKGRRIPANVQWVRIDEWALKGDSAGSYVDVR